LHFVWELSDRLLFYTLPISFWFPKQDTCVRYLWGGNQILSQIRFWLHFNYNSMYECFIPSSFDWRPHENQTFFFTHTEIHVPSDRVRVYATRALTMINFRGIQFTFYWFPKKIRVPYQGYFRVTYFESCCE
jgi:hypothetical protein